MIELLVVVAIIGILATLVFINVSGARAKSRDSARKADVSTISTAVSLFYADYKTYDLSLASPSPGCNCGWVYSSANIGGGSGWADLVGNGIYNQTAGADTGYATTSIIQYLITKNYMPSKLQFKGANISTSIGIGNYMYYPYRGVFTRLEVSATQTDWDNLKKYNPTDYKDSTTHDSNYIPTGGCGGTGSACASHMNYLVPNK